MADRSHLSIGEVLSLLQDEFPDVTISKIRFLESQGLLDPERTPSGYRKFYEADIERLRWILRHQRDHFLPLKVIKDRLQEAAAKGLVVPPDEPDPRPPGAGAIPTRRCSSRSRRPPRRGPPTWRPRPGDRRRPRPPPRSLPCPTPPTTTTTRSRPPSASAPPARAARPAPAMPPLPAAGRGPQPARPRADRRQLQPRGAGLGHRPRRAGAGRPDPLRPAHRAHRRGRHLLRRRRPRGGSHRGRLRPLRHRGPAPAHVQGGRRARGRLHGAGRHAAAQAAQPHRPPAGRRQPRRAGPPRRAAALGAPPGGPCATTQIPGSV